MIALVHMMCFWVGAVICGMGAIAAALGVIWLLGDIIVRRMISIPDLYRVVLAVKQEKRKKDQDDD